MPIPHTAKSPHFSSSTLSTPTLPTPKTAHHPYTAHPHTMYLLFYFKVVLLISNVDDSICPSPHFSSPTLSIPPHSTYHIFGSNHSHDTRLLARILISFPRCFPGVVAYNNFLYVVGGDDGSSNLASVEYYNSKNDTWTMLSTTMMLGRSYAGVCVIDRPIWPGVASLALSRCF